MIGENYMNEKDIKSEALVDYFKRNTVLCDAWYDGTVVKAVRNDKVDVQVLLSAQAVEKGVVKVGVYVDEANYDTSLLHERFGQDWMPDGTFREDSKNWETKAAGVQMWYRVDGINWVERFSEVEMARIIEVFQVVYDKMFN